MADYATLRCTSTGTAPDEAAWELLSNGIALGAFIGNYEDASKWARRRWHELGRTGYIFDTAGQLPEGIDR